MDREIISTCLSFIKRLNAVESNLSATLKALLDVKYKIGKNGVISESLYNFLSERDAPVSLLSTCKLPRK